MSVSRCLFFFFPTPKPLFFPTSASSIALKKYRRLIPWAECFLGNLAVYLWDVKMKLLDVVGAKTRTERRRRSERLGWVWGWGLKSLGEGGGKASDWLFFFFSHLPRSESTVWRPLSLVPSQGLWDRYVADVSKTCFECSNLLELCYRLTAGPDYVAGAWLRSGAFLGKNREIEILTADTI